MTHTSLVFLERVALLGGPDAAEQVKRRVEIKFASTNPKFITTIEEEVKLDVDIKNVSTLIVKVFEIDTTAYYRIRKADVPDDISLDGLVAKTETIHKYDDAPILKVRRSFSFPELNKRGVFVIEVWHYLPLFFFLTFSPVVFCINVLMILKS